MSFELITVLLYLLITLAIGLISSRKTKSAGAFQGNHMGTAAIVFAEPVNGWWDGNLRRIGIRIYLWNVRRMVYHCKWPWSFVFGNFFCKAVSELKYEYNSGNCGALFWDKIQKSFLCLAGFGDVGGRFKSNYCSRQIGTSFVGCGLSNNGYNFYTGIRRVYNFGRNAVCCCSATVCI